MSNINDIASSFQYLQKMLQKSGPAMGASYTLIGAVLLLGGIGYLIDLWKDTSPIFLLAGLIIGIIVGFYEIAKLMWSKPNK